MNVALLTCENFPELYVTDQFLIPELAKHGITAKAAVWDDKTINWSDFDYLIFRNTWDYFEKEMAFNDWLSQIEQLGIKTLNAIEIIQQNKHKFYLRELEEKGIPTIKTIFIERTNDLQLSELIPLQWKKAVIKPAFSGGAYQTAVFDAVDVDKISNQYKDIASEKELLLQEFIPEIKTLGETSFIFFNKQFSHAVNKIPMDGDFRVQIQFGGIYTAIQPSSELIEKAQRAINTFSGKLLYARVDGIIMNNELHLMEIECIEPDLYFNLSEGAQNRFVNAILELIKTQ